MLNFHDLENENESLKKIRIRHDIIFSIDGKYIFECKLL